MRAYSPLRYQVKDKIEVSDLEKKIFDRLLGTLSKFGLQTQLRVAGGWVRDKLLGKECNHIDIALDNMMGSEFVEKVRDYLLYIGEDAQGVCVIEKIDLKISGNQPVKAMAQICDLTLFRTVFSLPPGFEPPIADGCERLCITYLDTAWRLIQLLGESTFTDEEKRIAMYTALLLPLRNTTYRDKKAKHIPVMNWIIRESLKRKAKDAEMVLDFHRASCELMPLIPCLASNEDVLECSRLRVMTGFLLREVKEFWRVALLISTLLHPIDDSTEDVQLQLWKRRDVFKSVENRIVVKLGLESVRSKTIGEGETSKERIGG
ncbi:putative CCA tRNA nucleotidyltransferase 2 isoform X1 [Senna tora]|uniref:Putative CCA tRNA nucleotidyltransferase 2 isoform X1 n=1 Tax=Senna tora TaxID=362788 RepID=A0A834XGU0_9FABA|nr:putative CCA tRNA nucleotidyltransferase 2 isoform X1 [Senna tora]